MGSGGSSFQAPFGARLSVRWLFLRQCSAYITESPVGNNVRS